MTEKMDFFEFQKKMGFPQEDMDEMEDTRILTFYEGENESTISRLNGGAIVFPHREYRGMVKMGDTWICDLDKRDRVYFARPIIKIDSQFFFDLKREQMDVVVNTLWEKHKDMLEPMLEDKYRDSLKNVLEEKIANINKEKEEALEKIAELEADKNNLKKKMEMTIASMEEEMKELKENNEKANEQERNVPQDIISKSELHPLIERNEPDTLYSDSFNERYYTAHISYDRSLMTIKPDKNGKIHCKNKKLTIKGLGLVSEFQGKGTLPAEYNPKYGAILVMLK